jgi:hypothetical protein
VQEKVARLLPVLVIFALLAFSSFSGAMGIDGQQSLPEGKGEEVEALNTQDPPASPSPTVTPTPSPTAAPTASPDGSPSPSVPPKKMPPSPTPPAPAA